MASMIVTAQAKEPLDALVWRTLGIGSPAVEQVLEANPGLAELGPLLPEGRAVLIPDLAPASAELDLVKLWD